MKTLRVVDIVYETVVDGPGWRTSIYFAGCDHQCPHCHNMQTWSHEAGYSIDVNALAKKVLSTGHNITLSGGDPLLQNNDAMLALLAEFKSYGRNIWCYTGYRYEQVANYAMLDYVDVLVDGPFIEALKSDKLLFVGSSNQRLIDVKASKQAGAPILYKYSPWPVFS